MGGSQSKETNKENFWGGSSSKTTKTDILNSTKVANSIKKFNENISSVATTMMQTTMTEAAQGAEATNILEISGNKIKGDINIGAIDQSNNVKMNLSVLTKTELKADMVADMTNKLQLQLANDATGTNEQNSKDGEQVFSEVANAIADTVQGVANSVMGGSSKESTETNVKNIMDVSNSTELINKVNNSVTADMVMKTVTKVSKRLGAMNKTKIKGNKTTGKKGGDLNIASVNQENVVTMMTEVVTESGLGNKILAKLLNVDEADIKNAAEGETTITDEEIGTLEAGGDAVGNVIEKGGEAVANAALGIGGGIGAAMGGMMMPFIIIAVVAVVGLIVLKLLSKKGMDKKAIVDKSKMTFGAGLFKGGSIKKLLNNSYIKKIQKQLMKYATIDNLILILALAVGYKFLPKIINFIKNKLQKKEKFTNEKDDKKIIQLKNKEGKYLIQGEDKLHFGGNKDDGLKFLLKVFKDNKHLKLMMKGNDGKTIILTFHKKKFILKEDKENKPLKGILNFFHNDNKFQLKRKKKYIGYKNDNFFGSKKKKSACDFYYDFIEPN
jgi:hypothetical protein